MSSELLQSSVTSVHLFAASVSYLCLQLWDEKTKVLYHCWKTAQQSSGMV